jgi:hypothetical protein
MAKSDLLKEAIADAKAVKETALANAKIALQEAFMPRFENMLATSMVHEMEGDEEEMPAEEPEMDMAAGEHGMEGEEGDFNWTDDHLSASVGGNDYDFTVGMGGDDEEMPEEMPEEEPVSDEDMGAEYNEGYTDEGYTDEGLTNSQDNLDLESIIRELEEQMEDDAMSAEMPAEDPNAIVPEGHEYGHDDDENIDEIIEAILREQEEEDAATEPAATEPATPEVVEAMEAELKTKDADLQEAYNTVKQLKSIINEVNLLNAKLLYTNKLFRNFELSENQKMKVIENFDRAGNPREVKLVFTTLAESFKRPATKKRVVKESAASRPTRTTAPSKQTTQVLSEGFELANRWKKLAGLL